MDINVDFIYPIGSIYMSVNSTSPASLFGGTWERIKDRFLLSAGDTYTAGNTGGEASVTLTINQIPYHHHNLGLTSSAGNGNIMPQYTALSNEFAKGTTKYNTIDTTNIGGGLAHNNMPPYLVVYVWKRTA